MSEARDVENLKGAIDLGGRTIQALILVNGAAAVSILTFLGNVLSRSSTAIQLDPFPLSFALKIFAWGVFSAVISSIFAYLSQLGSAIRWPPSFEITFRALAIVAGILSVALFLFGVQKAGDSFPHRIAAAPIAAVTTPAPRPNFAASPNAH